MKKLIIAISLILSSCSSNVKSGWSCPTPEGGKGSCLSIKEADLVGEINADSENKSNFTYLDSAQKIEIKLIAPKLADLKKITTKSVSPADSTPNGASPHDATFELQNKLRTQERVGKIWFAPHIDSEGNQHSESVIYVVDEESKWVIQR